MFGLCFQIQKSACQFKSHSNSESGAGSFCFEKLKISYFAKNRNKLCLLSKIKDRN